MIDAGCGYNILWLFVVSGLLFTMLRWVGMFGLVVRGLRCFLVCMVVALFDFVVRYWFCLF